MPKKIWERADNVLCDEKNAKEVKQAEKALKKTKAYALVMHKIHELSNDPRAEIDIIYDIDNGLSVVKVYTDLKLARKALQAAVDNFAETSDIECDAWFKNTFTLLETEIYL